jgi:hypothetical protein
MPDLSCLSKIEDEHKTFPFLACLDESSLYAIKTAYRRASDYKKRLILPGEEPDIIPFDAAKEMQRAPESEEHMRRDR